MLAKQASSSRLPKLAAAVQAFLDDQEWTDKIEVDEDGDTLVNFSYEVAGQSYDVFIETHENAERALAYFYAPYTVPEHRVPQLCILLNEVNCRFTLGRLAAVKFRDARRVQFRVGCNVEGSALTGVMIRNMMVMGAHVFEEFGQLISQVALTKTAAADALVEFDADKDRVEQDVPESL